MITAEQAYLKFLQKVEKNVTNDNLSTSRGSFTLLYNESKNKFTEIHLQQRGVDDIRYVQHLLVLDKTLEFSRQKEDHFDFLLPKDYLDLSDARALGSKRNCLRKSIKLWELQTENLNEMIFDEDSKPSFEWRESPFSINSNKISIYTDKTFSIDQVLLDYYKYPQEIKLLNPFDPESKFDNTIDLGWDEKALDRIISMCAAEFDLNEADPRVQFQQARQQK